MSSKATRPSRPRAFMVNSRRSRLQKRLGSGARANGWAVPMVASFIAMSPRYSHRRHARRYCALLSAGPPQRLERGAQFVEFGSEAGPVSGLEAFEGAVVVGKGRVRAVALDDGGRDAGRRFRGARAGRLPEQCRKRVRKRLLHHNAVAVSGDYSFELRQLPGLGAQIKRRNVEDRVLDRYHDQMPA